MIARAVGRDTLPPALIFAGPAGVGKFATAVALAQALNCERPVRGEGLAVDSCGTCHTCVRIGRLLSRPGQGPSALDCVLVLAPDEKGSIKVGPTREIIDKTGYRPLEGRRRVVVVDEADALEVSAQNALLKVLEEPPPSTVFVLVTSRPDALLATIRSRCPRLRFGLLSTDEMVEALVDRFGVAEGEARRVAGTSNGSLGQALRRLAGEEQDLRGLAVEVLARVAGAGSPASRLAIGRLLVAKSADEGRKKGSDGVSRAVLTERIDALGAILRDVEVVSTRAEARWLASADLAADVAALAGGFAPGRAARAFAAVDRARAALERNASPKVVADWLALQL